MSSIAQIQVQKLFVVALVLKVVSAFFGWYLKMPWSLGFAFPLLAMLSYIVLGSFRKDNDVSDEKFADTCYYLGFIFTITSIIFSLFDLPNIGTHIQDIAVRFGAAMVSTVLGLGVRVYLVSFRQDINDAIRDAEDAVLDATRKFTEQLTIVLEKLRDFESQVDSAAKGTVERVNLQIENLSMHHSEQLTEFFTKLTEQNQKAFVLALGEVKTASRHLADSVDGYSNGMRSNLGSIEAKVVAFADAVTNRLKTTTFPDDYFAKQLEAPLAELGRSANDISTHIRQASAQVGQSSTVLGGALKKLQDKAASVDESLDTVVNLATRQQAILDSAQGQLNALSQLAATLTNLDVALNNTLVGLNASNNTTNELNARVSGLTNESAAGRESLASALATLVGKLEANAVATSTVAEKLDAETRVKVAANETLAQKLAANSDAANIAVNTMVARLEASQAATTALVARLNESVAISEQVVGKLTRIASTDKEAAEQLGALGLQANAAIEKVAQAIGELQAMVLQLSRLDIGLLTHGSELKEVVNEIRSFKMTVEAAQLRPEAAVSITAPVPIAAAVGVTLPESRPPEVPFSDSGTSGDSRPMYVDGQPWPWEAAREVGK